MNYRDSFATFLTVAISGAALGAPKIDPATRAFVKKCNVYVDVDSKNDFGFRLSREKEKLAKYKVPMTLRMKNCDSLKYSVSLGNGSVTENLMGFPTNDDPDYKGMRFEWSSESPSQRFWKFDFYEWESSGWELVHKYTGRRIRTETECGGAPIVIGKDYLATICQGTYANTSPTLYIANIRSSITRWSEEISLSTLFGCEFFDWDGFRFLRSPILEISGYCKAPVGGTEVGASRTGVLQFHISDSEITFQEGAKATSWKWAAQSSQ